MSEAAAPAKHPLPVVLPWLSQGTAAFEVAARALGEEGVRAASALPQWTGAHVVAHVARNSDALVNLLTWARTGSPTPMYPDAASRDRDIEQGASRPAADLVADLLDSDTRLADAIAELPEAAWTAAVRTAQGRTVQAATVPWMRAREVWVHAVDLGGAQFEEFPVPLLDALLDDALMTMAGRDDPPHLLLQDSATGRERELPGAGEVAVVRGPASALCAYLLRGARTPQLRGAPGAPVSSVPSVPRWL